MDDEIFGGNNPQENNVPQNETESDLTEVNSEPDDVNAACENTEKTDTQNDAAASDMYHYNREQYNQQFNPQNNNYQPYSAPNQGYNYYNGQQIYNGQNPGNAYQYNPSPAEKPKKKASPGMKVFIALIAIIIALSVALTVSLFANGDNNSNSAQNNGIVAGDNDTNKPDTENVDDITTSDSSNSAGEAVEVAKIAQKYNVGILVYQNNSLYTEGSGVIVKEDNDGKFTYIVTCAHVINHNNVALSVLMQDGTEHPADLIGLDTRTDLAVVRIEVSGLPKAEIASSDSLIVGQTVYAIGNPGGSEFFGSVTNGIISAIDRPVSSNTGYEMECIQHTSAINPGNSGGALVNGEGKLIGINSMKIASTEYESMGFAVPSSVVVEVFNSIIENGYVAGRAKLGISYTTPSNFSQTYAMYVQMKGLPTGTIVIAAVSEDSDLADKDVKEGDMIIAVNGKEMKNTDMLSEMIEDMSVGDSLTLTIVRVNTDNWSQTERDVKVTLVEDRGTSAPVTEESNDSDVPEDPFSGNEGYQDWFEYYKDFFGY